MLNFICHISEEVSSDSQMSLLYHKFCYSLRCCRTHAFFYCYREGNMATHFISLGFIILDYLISTASLPTTLFSQIPNHFLTNWISPVWVLLILVGPLCSLQTIVRTAFCHLTNCSSTKEPVCPWLLSLLSNLCWGPLSNTFWEPNYMFTGLSYAQAD